MSGSRLLLITAMLVLIVWTALKVVEAKQQTRQLFAVREALRTGADELSVIQGQLQVELATFADYERIEKKARNNLHMRTPDMQEIEVLETE
ncbi:MAG: cell division protein FtsL [Pseudomonadota bacterium]|nr:cell division protein FtsL [Pseudomonadota bacterium]